MKQLILGLAAVALIAGTNVASAKSAHKVSGGAGNALVQRSVSLPSQSAYHPNADLKYGPQPDFPQSPAGGGY